MGLIVCTPQLYFMQSQPLRLGEAKIVGTRLAPRIPQEEIRGSAAARLSVPRGPTPRMSRSRRTRLHATVQALVAVIPLAVLPVSLFVFYPVFSTLSAAIQAIF